MVMNACLPLCLHMGPSGHTMSGRNSTLGHLKKPQSLSDIATVFADGFTMEANITTSYGDAGYA